MCEIFVCVLILRLEYNVYSPATLTLYFVAQPMFNKMSVYSTVVFNQLKKINKEGGPNQNLSSRTVLITSSGFPLC